MKEEGGDEKFSLGLIELGLIEDGKFSLGLIELEIPVKHPSGEVREAVPPRSRN